MATYARPTVRPRATDSKPEARTPSGTPGRAGELVDRMRAGVYETAHVAAPVWTPPFEYEFIAAHMPEEDRREAYLARCKAWFAANPPAEWRAVVTPKPLTNTDAVLNLFARYKGKRPPHEELAGAWRSAGYTDARIAKALKWHKTMEATAEARQEALDLVFAKYPALHKPAPKVKKVVKAVKKRI